MAEKNRFRIISTIADIRKRFNSILDNMHMLRVESINERCLLEEKKEEYFSLAFELATCIEAFSDRDQLLLKKLEIIANELTKEDVLFNYDPLQDDFWKKKQPVFINTLNSVLISLLKDRFDGTDKKHHIIQSIKHLIEPINKSEEYIPDIRPYFGAVDLNLFKNLGLSYGRRDQEMTMYEGGLVALVNRHNNENVMQKTTKHAKQFGFFYLSFLVPKKEIFENFLKDINTIKGFNFVEVIGDNCRYMKKIGKLDYKHTNSLLDDLHEALEILERKDIKKSPFELSNDEIGNIEHHRDFLVNINRKPYYLIRDNYRDYSKSQILYPTDTGLNFICFINSTEAQYNLESTIHSLKRNAPAESKLRYISDITSSTYSHIITFNNENKIQEDYEVLK